jgi:predicted neuraminidase
MAFPIRILLVIVVWLLAVSLWRWRSDLSPKKGFGTEFRALPVSMGGPIFKKTIVNPEQGLPMVHVASLSGLEGGIDAAVWYGGSSECASDVKIYFSESENDGAWSTPRAVMDRSQAERDLQRPVQSVGNAILLAGANGSMRLIFVTIAMGRWSGSQLNTSFSTDGGITWSPAERLTLSPFFNLSELVRNRPVPVAANAWCAPIYQEFLGKFPELLWIRENKGRLDYSKSRIAGGCSSFQPSLVPLDATRSIALLRDYTANRKILMSRSDDSGMAWSTPRPTQLPNPDSGISGLKLSDGKILLAYNDSTDSRDNLSLAVSGDEGRTWKKLVALENEPGSTFSYPFLMHSRDGMIELAYTRKRTEIALTRFNEDWVAEALSSQGKAGAEANHP